MHTGIMDRKAVEEASAASPWSTVHFSRSIIPVLPPSFNPIPTLVLKKFTGPIFVIPAQGRDGSGRGFWKKRLLTERRKPCMLKTSSYRKDDEQESTPDDTFQRASAGEKRHGRAGGRWPGSCMADRRCIGYDVCARDSAGV
jgi:hypothetical protein